MTILVTSSSTTTTRTCIEYDYMHMHVLYVHYTMQRIMQCSNMRILIDRYYVKLCTESYILHNSLQHECN